LKISTTMKRPSLMD